MKKEVNTNTIDNFPVIEDSERLKREYNKMKQKECRDKKKLSSIPANNPDANRERVKAFRENKEVLNITASPELCNKFRSKATKLKVTYDMLLEILLG